MVTQSLERCQLTPNSDPRSQICRHWNTESELSLVKHSAPREYDCMRQIERAITSVIPTKLELETRTSSRTEGMGQRFSVSHNCNWGDFNFSFISHRENEGLNEFVKDGVWKWIRPLKDVASNWSDGDGIDNYPDSMLDFEFVTSAAKQLDCTCEIIERLGNFPDDETTSDHRPVEL